MGNNPNFQKCVLARVYVSIKLLPNVKHHRTMGKLYKNCVLVYLHTLEPFEIGNSIYLPLILVSVVSLKIIRNVYMKLTGNFVLINVDDSITQET